MMPKVLLHIASSLALLGAASCGKDAPIEPGEPTASFDGTWVGVKRLVSCSPAGPTCALQPLGEQTYFSATLTHEADVVDGSVILSEPTPLALPYGFFIKGKVSPSAQLTFERVFFQDVGEPPYSGDVSLKASPANRLSGQMTKQPSGGDTVTLVWNVEAIRR